MGGQHGVDARVVLRGAGEQGQHTAVGFDGFCGELENKGPAPGGDWWDRLLLVKQASATYAKR